MEIKRRKFQGVLNILSFNRHFYLLGLAALAAVYVCFLVFNWPVYIFLWVAIAFFYGLIMPLLISAYVYDFSGFYTFNWLSKQVTNADEIKLIVNINAGFDETSFTINNKFPNAELRVFDFYNAEQHTEPAIKRARKVTQLYPGTAQIKTNFIPLQSNTVDIVFLLSAAHEIRKQEEKILFLKECRRICKQDGKIIMVEHLRDLPNFLAFSIGFTHFFSRTTWKNAFTEAVFSSFEETKFTPFMSVFNCKP